MLKYEFELLTGLQVTNNDYYTYIEPKYMKSKLNKQQWCKQYKNTLKQDKQAIYKKDLKQSLKYSIESWEEAIKDERYWQFVDEEEIYTIKYQDGTILYFDYEYEGKKPSLINIVNIHFSNADCCMDFYYDWIGDQESWQLWHDMNWNLPNNPLIVNDMDDYYKMFDVC